MTKSKGLLAIGFAMVMLAGCGVTMPSRAKLERYCTDAEKPAWPANAETLYFATTRARQCARDGRLGFSNYRGGESHYGSAAIPPGDDGWSRHVSRLAARKEDWLGDVQVQAEQAGTDRPLIVYVHGYWNGFDEALQRGLTLSRLRGGQVPVVVATWPSRDAFVSYTYDEASVEWAQEGLTDLLRDLTLLSRNITVVAHSMGNRPVLSAVLDLDREWSTPSQHIRKLVLASPDVDRDSALRPDGLLDRILSVKGREVLVYTSSADIANKASHRVHGHSRLGSTNCRFDVSHDLQTTKARDCHQRTEAAGLVIVDTGEVHAGGARHADFVDSLPVREDLRRFLVDCPHPSWRVPMGNSQRGGWRIDRNKARDAGPDNCKKPPTLDGCPPSDCLP